MPRRLLLIFLFSLAALPRVGAMTALPLNLDQLTEQADRIFVGRCESVTEALDERGLPATYARFRVEEGLKGVSGGRTVLIKQFGAARAPLKVAEGESAVVAPKTVALSGASYRPGASYLLFLYPESDWGFTSPVGGGQGRFEIEDSGPAALGVAPSGGRLVKTFRDGPVPLNDFVGEIRKRVP